MPVGASVFFQHSYMPDYNHEIRAQKTIKYGDENLTADFKNYEAVYALTDVSGTYEFELQYIVDPDVEAEDTSVYAKYITLVTGFSIMGAAFFVFVLPECIKKYRAKKQKERLAEFEQRKQNVEVVIEGDVQLGENVNSIIRD